LKNTIKYSVSGFLVVLLMFGSDHSHAANNKNSDSKYKDIPTFFIEKLRADLPIEGFISETLRPIRQYSADHKVLTKEVILEAQTRKQAASRSYHVQRVLLADLDNDGKVTKAEATNFLRHENSYATDEILMRSVEEFMTADANHDDVIHYDEMRTESTQGSTQHETELSKLEALRIDFTGADGQLTAAEVEAQARKIFAEVDVDKDGILSREEFSAIQKQSNATTPIFIPRSSGRRCDMPKPAADDIISVFSTYDGAAVSTISLDGQDQETFTSHIKIEKGEKPIYLVLSSFSPMIWQIDGAKERISRVVLLSGQATTSKQNATGVTGIAKDKVSFVQPDSCFRFFTKTDSIEATQAKGSLVRTLGRAVDSFGANQQASTILIPSAKAEPVDPETTKKLYEPTEEFEKFAWREALRHHPAGTDNIKLESVVAQSHTEAYTVLPQEAGIAQLMKQGVLERLSSRDYKIVKPLSRYPAGLAGGHAVRFLLSKGLPEPDGDSGHCCVVSEETGQSIGTIPDMCH